MRLDQMLFTAALKMESASTEGDTIRILGYRQDRLSLADGGKWTNANHARVRNGACRALARTFNGKPALNGHEWSNVEARFGTIVKCEKVEAGEDVQLIYEVQLNGDGKRLLADGKLDRFSFGIMRADGEVHCTVHKAKLWSTDECYCWPGYGTKMDDGSVKICELEFQDPEGVELSAVNVPAVPGTGILAAHANVGAEAILDIQLAAIAEITGLEVPDRVRMRLQAGPNPQGVSPAALTLGSVEAQPETQPEDLMRQKLIAKFGLAADATDEQIEAAIDKSELTNRDNTATLEASVVEARLAALKARGLTDDQAKVLRVQFEAHGHKTFSASADAVDAVLPTKAPAIGRAALQSDVVAVSAATFGTPEQHQRAVIFDASPANRELARRLGLSREDVVVNGPDDLTVVGPDSDEGRRIKENLI